MKKLMILILLLVGQNLYSQSLKLTHPTGGEKFIIGSDTVITWEGVPDTEPIRIEFSNDNGLTWQTLTNSATGLKYKWENIPNLPSDECLIRAIHMNTPGIEWEKNYGGSNGDEAYSIQQTTDGGYIIAGNKFSKDGVVKENVWSLDYWILKLRSDGSLEWEKIFGGSKHDEAYSIQQTTDGGYIVSGYSESSDGDISSPKGGEDYWILKLGEEGDLEWEKSYGGSGNEHATSIQQTTDGGYIVAGYTDSFDGDVNEKIGYYDYWILKLSSDGALEWEKCYGGTEDDRAKSIQQTTDGGCIIAGYSASSDGDVSENQGYADFWIIKIMSNGSLEWEQSYGGSDSDHATSIQQTKDGGYIVAGVSNSDDGDVSKNQGDGDYWILKLRSDGSLEWEKSYGGSDSDHAYSIQQTKDDGYIISGESFSDDGDLSGNKGGYDYWILKLSSVGFLEWEQNFGGSDWEGANSIQQTDDGGYIVAGYTYSADGDISKNNEYIDFWIVKLFPEEEPVVQSDSSGLFSIENPSNVERLPILSNTAGINRITPNPADNNINISVTIAESGQTSIAIYNIEGEKVSEIYAGEVATFGTYEFTSDISKLSNGTYYVIFKTPTVKDSQSIMIAR